MASQMMDDSVHRAEVIAQYSQPKTQGNRMMPTERERITKKIRDAQQFSDSYSQAKDAFIILEEVSGFLRTIYEDVIIEDEEHVQTLCDLMIKVETFLAK